MRNDLQSASVIVLAKACFLSKWIDILGFFLSLRNFSSARTWTLILELFGCQLARADLMPTAEHTDCDLCFVEGYYLVARHEPILFLVRSIKTRDIR